MTPVNTPLEYMETQVAGSRRFFVEVDHPVLGRHPYAGPPYRLTETPLRAPTAAPLLGEHNEEILGGTELDAPEACSPERGGANPREAPVACLPLEGIRIVEFTAGAVGPILARLLTEFGAESIKVETRKHPDLSRGSRPDRINRGVTFADYSRSRRAVTLDVTHPESRPLVEDLVKISDIVVENFSAGTMQKLGLDYRRLREWNPAIIMVSLQGLGATETHSVTFGQNIPPLIGLTYLWNDPGASRPVGSQLVYPDSFAGIQAACAVLAALDYRRRTGKGQYIDCAQAECAAALLGPYYLDCAVNGRVPEPMGNGSPWAAPHGCYRCAGDDAWCVIAVYTDAEWRSFRRVLGDPAWSRDAKFADLPGRLRHREELDRLVEAWTTEHPPYGVMTRLQAAGVAAGVVQNMAQVRDDPHLKARGFLVEVEHPEMGHILHGGFPVHLSGSPGEVRSHAPLLGQHNGQVYEDLLGIPPEEVQRLTAAGVLT